MKRWFAAFMCLLLGLPFAAGAEGQEQWLYEKSIAAADMLGRLAASDAYLSLLGLSEGLAEKAGALREVDFSAPVRVSVFSYRQGPFEMFFSGEKDEAVRAYARERMHAAVPNFITAQAGAEMLALSSVLTYSAAWQKPEELTEDALVYLEYGGTFAVAATFLLHENGVVTINAMVVPQTDGTQLESLCPFLDLQAALAGADE